MLLKANIDIELLDTLKGELITFDKNADWVAHELLGDLKGLGGKGGREHANLHSK
jgi:hypothetical protein